ncbi:MAG: hypothetical protein V1912_11295 [bacterium]
MKRMATPVAARHLPPPIPPTGNDKGGPVHFERHQELGCTGMIGAFAGALTLLVILLALMGTGSW